MLHDIPMDATPDEPISALSELKKQGKILNIGISNVNLDQLRRYNYSGEIKFIQNRLSLISPPNDNLLNDYLRVNNIFNIPYRVMERGLLTNRILMGFSLRDSDLRQTKPIFSREVAPRIFQWVVSYIKPIADKNNIPIEGLSIAWALCQPRVGLCSVGVTSVDQLDIILKSREVRLSENALQELDFAIQKLLDFVPEMYSIL